MREIRRIVIVSVFVVSFIFISSTTLNAQAAASYLFLEVIDSNQKPVADAKIEEFVPYQPQTNQTDEKGSLQLRYMFIPNLSELKISKADYYPFELFGLMRETFYEGQFLRFREELKIELLKIPQNKVEKKALGNEQLKRDFFLAVLKGDTPKVHKLLKSGIDPNISTDDLRGVPHPKDIPAILYAADNADIKTMNAFLAAGIDLRKENSNIRNVLSYYIGSFNKHLSTTKGDPGDFIKYIDTLLKAGASLKSTDARGETLLTVAAKQNNIELVKKLLDRGVAINAQNKDGSTALMSMFDFESSPRIDDRKIDIINLLLKSGTDPNIIKESDYGCDAPLMYAVQYGQFPLIKLLLSFKADANLKCKSGENVLNRFRFWGRGKTDKYLELVNILTDTGADVNASGESGITPLMTAVEAQNIPVIKKLLSQGANINAQDKLGRTALMFSTLGPPIVPPGKPEIEIVDLLLKSGADPNLVTNGISHESFGTALSAAVWHEPLYCIFRSKQVDCWQQNNVQYASEEILKLLIANKANVNLTFQNKDTPLISAVKGGRIEAVKLLIEAGTDIKGEPGQRALQIARERLKTAKDKVMFEEIIKILETAGTK